MYNQESHLDFFVPNMALFVQKSNLSQETKVALFIIAFTSVFVLAQFAIGFQLALFLASMIVSVALILWHPRAGFYSMLVLTVIFERFYTLQPLVIGHSAYKLYPIDIFIVAILIATAFRLAFRKVAFTFNRADIILAVFFFVATLIFAKDIISFGGKNIESALSTWKSYLFYGSLYFLVPMLITRKQELIRSAKFFLAAAFVATIFIFIGIVRGEGLWTEYTPLSTSGVRILAFPHAYYFSLALLTVLYSSKQWISFDKATRWFMYGIMSLWVAGIVGSMMRHLWLGLGISVFLMLFILAKEYRRSIGGVSRVFIVGACAAFVVFFYIIALFPRSDIGEQSMMAASALSERVVSIGNSNDESVAWRGAVWGSAFHTFSDHILLGIGLGAHVPVEIGEYREFVEIRNIHNSWLALLVQTGIVGAGLFFLFLWSLFFSVWRNRSDDSVLETAKYATIGILLFQGVIFLSQPYLETNLLGIFFWINLGIMRSLLNYEHS